MSLSLGLKEKFGGGGTELGRSRPTHTAKATIARRRDPQSGKASAASRRAELAENNRRKSGAAADTPFGGGGHRTAEGRAKRDPKAASRPVFFGAAKPQ